MFLNSKLKIIRKLEYIQYWLAMDHVGRIRTFGLFSHLRYVFNFNISRFVVNLQSDLADLLALEIPQGYLVREMVTSDPNEISIWISIVNEAYPDATENEDSFQKHLNQHPFLNIQKIFFITKVGKPVGTVSVGLYRKNPDYGGDARIAILPSEQGKGLGLFAINYAFHYLKNQGINKGETVISFKRTQSIILHFKCGFRPQFDRNKMVYDGQKRMWPVRLIVKVKVSKWLNNFLVTN